MAVLSADVNLSFVGPTRSVGLAVNVADIYYQGSIVFIDTGGGSQVLPASADPAVGISPKKQTLATTDLAEVVVEAMCWMPLATGLTASSEGDWLVHDVSATQSDNPVDMVAGLAITAAAGDTIIGRIIKVETARMLIWISPSITGTQYVATAGWGG